MILKKIIIFVTIFYSLNAEIIYQHADEELIGIEYDLDLSVFHKNVNVFLLNQYHRYWNGRANGKGAHLIHQFSSINNEVECVDSKRYYLSTISKLDLRSLQEILLNKSKITYDLDIEFKEENEDYSIKHKSDTITVTIFVTQILRFHIPNIMTTPLVSARTEIELSCFDVDDEDYDTNVKQVFVEEDGATGGFDNKAMSDYDSQQRLESEEKQNKKKNYQHQDQINEESESEESESEESKSKENKSKESESKEDEIYSTGSELNRDKARKKLSKKKDNPIVKRFRALGFMKRKDKRVKVKEEGASFISHIGELDEEKQIIDDEKYAKALEKEDMERLRRRGEQKYSPEVNFYTEDIQKQIEGDEIIARDIYEEEKRQIKRRERNYYRESEDELYGNLHSLKNQVESLE